MRRVVSLFAVAGLSLGTLACSGEGEMEKAGKAMDEAVEDAREHAEEAVESGRQVLEDAGEELDEAEEKAKKMAEGEH